MNVDSRSLGVYALVFSILASLALATEARADRVVVLRLLADEGVSEERLDDIEERLAAAVVAAGHEFVTEPRALQVAPDELPSNPNEMRAIAELQAAQWVLIGRISPAPSGYRLGLQAFSVAWDRQEALDALVLSEGEEARLQLIMERILSREGVEDAREWLTTGEDAPAELERQRVEAEAAEEARLAEEREREQAAQRARDAEEAEARRLAEESARTWDERERYGEGGRMMGAGGVAGTALVAVPEAASGGGLVSIQGRFGYGLESVPGLELRAGLDVTFGAASGFALTGGAVYLTSPFEETPIFLGGGLEVGYYQALTGNRVPSLIVRASGVGSWRVGENIFLEASLPEITVLTANGGALAIGASLRVGTRF